jgi:hypothetical protein
LRIISEISLVILILTLPCMWGNLTVHAFNYAAL